MKKHNFISITLIISGLALNPLIANTVVNRVTYIQTTNQTIKSSIASILYNRGIDEDAAEEIANNLLDEDETLLAMMLQNLEKECIVSREEILDYMSTAALHRQNIHFDSYDHLITMISKIKQTSLEKHTLKLLKHIAEKNSLLVV
ncbi:hypothetical protein [Sulfurovum sp.]|uniref:hypothetical protein n=1 Tax=Sulfurovum sp. TaxID=1969726 RepID=UPI00356593F0